jgi:hypothetical protein
MAPEPTRLGRNGDQIMANVQRKRWFSVLPDEQHDEHAWGTTASFYKYWNELPWPVFDHVSAWGEWSDLNTKINGQWI